jgi:hypothetical protein
MFRNVASCSPVVHRGFGGICFPIYKMLQSCSLRLPLLHASCLFFIFKEGDSIFLRNDGKFLRDYIASHANQHCDSLRYDKYESVLKTELPNFCNALYNVQTHARRQYDQEVITIKCLEPSVITKLMVKIYNQITIQFLLLFQTFTLCYLEAHGSVVGWGTMLQAGRSRVRVPMRSLDFFQLT